MAADKSLCTAAQQRCFLRRENRGSRRIARRRETKGLRRAPVEVSGRDDALVDLELEQRALRRVVKLSVDGAAIVILLREGLLRGPDSVSRGVDRERIRGPGRPASAQDQALFELNRQGSARRHPNIARLRQQ